VINDRVYDVSKYANEHPGGPIVLLNKAGRNASLAFEQASHSKNAKDNIMGKYEIGKIDLNSVMADWQREEESAAPNIFLTVGVVLIVLLLIYYMAA
jgi:cytochrome b involved in lipid metabolism